MTYAFIQDGVIVKIGPRPKWLDSDGHALTDAELGAHGWYPVGASDDLPEGKIVVSTSIALIYGLPKYVDVLGDLTLEDHRAAKLAALADRRWQAETGGTMVNGVPIKTDSESTRKITSAYVMADKNPDFAVRWKVETGMFVTLDAATIIAIGDAVTAHVQACFDNEDVLTAAILAAGNRIELDAIDINTGWPE